MSKNNLETPEITFTGIQIATKFGHIIPPLEPIILENLLASLGYTFEVPRGAVPLSGNVSQLKTGRKDDIEIFYNYDKQILSIKGNNPQKIVKSFRESYDHIQQATKPIKLKIIFYEAFISAIAQGTRNPLEAFSSDNNKLKRAKEFDLLFGEGVSPFGVRLSPSNADIDSANWFDFRLEPTVFQPTSLYITALIFRNEDVEKTINTILNFQDIAKRSIQIIEG